MCCKLLGITELQKPRNKWCPHCDIGKGCKIYNDRPGSCSEFRCLYLDSDTIPEDERPDKTGVVMFFPNDQQTVQVHVDPHRPHGWEQGVTGRLLQALAGQLPVLVSIGEKRKFLGTEEMHRDVLVKIDSGKS